MSEVTRVHVFVSGSVQGVFFRYETRERARSRGLAGWVRNLPDGRVEAVFEGPDDADEAYVDIYGKPGEYQGELKVYGRRGEPCRRCRTPIEVVKYSGRNSYFCPQCQS